MGGGHIYWDHRSDVGLLNAQLFLNKKISERKIVKMTLRLLPVRKSQSVLFILAAPLLRISKGSAI